MEGEGAEHRKAAGGAAANRAALRVDAAGLDQGLGAVDAVADVPRAPGAAKGVPIGPAVARAPSVIDIEHGKAPAGPELHLQVEGRGGGRRGAPVADDEQRRGRGRGRNQSIFWRVEVAVGRLPVRRGEGQRLGLGQSPLRQREGAAFPQDFRTAIEG